MLNHPLDYNTRKTLCAHLGDRAGKEIADLLLSMCRQIELLERQKAEATYDACLTAPVGCDKDEVGEALQPVTLERRIG